MVSFEVVAVILKLESLLSMTNRSRPKNSPHYNPAHVQPSPPALPLPRLILIVSVGPAILLAAFVFSLAFSSPPHWPYNRATQ